MGAAGSERGHPMAAAPFGARLYRLLASRRHLSISPGRHDATRYPRRIMMLSSFSEAFAPAP